MSTVSGVSSSADSYPAQLTQAAALRQSLVAIGNAIESGNMTAAGNLLTTFMQDNPQYDTTSSSGSSTDPINQDFQTLTTAVANNQVSAAQSAWQKIQTDLSQAGVNLNSTAASTAQIIAQSEASINQELLTALFGSSSGTGTSVASLLGGISDTSGSTGLSSSLLSQWLTYQENGTASPPAATTQGGSVLDATG